MPDPKFEKAELPFNDTTAIHMAMDREVWAAEARARDQYGSAREFELTALLLRDWAARQKESTQQTGDRPTTSEYTSGT